jgi:APA family basic amino acid/polyamine antiporter
MPEAATAPEREQTTFVRGLGLFDSTMLVAGSMIGSGIFIVSADIGRQVGGAGWLLAVWAITGALTLMAALSYGELAAMMPRAGGQYVYLREAYNPLFGFLYGWTLFLVIQTGTMAAVAVAFARFFSVLVPAIADGPGREIVRYGRFAIYPTTLVAIGVMALLTWSNTTGLRTGKIVQNVFTVAKILALAGLIGLCLFVGGVNASHGDFWKATFTAPVARGSAEYTTTVLTSGALLLAIGTAMVGSLFSSDAWNNITFTAGEVKNPKRNLPLSLALGVGLVSTLYLLANVGYLAVLPLDGSPTGTSVVERGIKFAQSDRVGTAAAEAILGGRGAIIMAVLIMVSTFGCVNGLILSGARVYFAMAQDGLFFRKLGSLNSQSVPRNALVVQCIWACLLTASGSYGELLDYVIFAVMIFYVLTIIGLFILRRKRPDAERPYKAFGYPVIPAIYVIAASFIALNLLISAKTRAQAWPGLLIVLMGIPVYFWWRRNPGAASAATSSDK